MIRKKTTDVFVRTSGADDDSIGYSERGNGELDIHQHSRVRDERIVKSGNSHHDSNRLTPVDIENFHRENGTLPKLTTPEQKTLTTDPNATMSVRLIFNRFQKQLEELLAFSSADSEEEQTKRIESLARNIIYSIFLIMNRSLEREGTVKLEDCIDVIEVIQGNFREDFIKALQLDALDKQNNIAPAPRDYWIVDREESEYRRRLGMGVSIPALLRTFHTPKKTQLFLELGPGEGRLLKEVSQIDGYKTFAICNKLHFALDKLINRIINWGKLEEASETNLTEEDRSIISRFIYYIVISKGDVDPENLEYDEEILASLTDKVHALPRHLRKKISLLPQTNTIPGPQYKNKERITKPKHLKEICEILAANIDNFFLDNIEKIDLHELIEAHTTGAMFSDFSRIAQMEDNKVDFAISLRATIYKYGSEYVRLIEEISKKLSEDGIYIDDSIRCHDGTKYRLAELWKVQQRIPQTIFVILGTALEGEDFNQEKPVPLSFIISNDPKKLGYIKKNLPEDHKLITLVDLVRMDAYVQTLDPNQTTLRELQRASIRKN